MRKEIWRNEKRIRIAAILLTVILLGLTAMAVRSEGVHTKKFLMSLFLSLSAGVYLLLKQDFGLVRNGLTIATVPFLSMWFLQWFTYDPRKMLPKMILLNCIFFYLFFLGLSFLLGSFRRGYCIAAALSMVVGVVNYFVVKFRSTPIVPWDFLSIGTAVTVADNYTYTVTWRLLLIVMGYIFMILTAARITWKTGKLKIRIPAFVCSLALLLIIGVGLQEESFRYFWGMNQILFFPTKRYEKNGVVSAFVSTLYLVKIQRPDNYSVQNVEEIAAAAQKEYDDNTKKHLPETDTDFETKSIQKASEGSMEDNYPNIIVIMDEAFSDLALLGEFETNEDYMPFTRSLMETYTSGNLMVSIKGGNTATTEFEFLSGDTMAFLTEGSVAYQQYIKGELPTIATQLAHLGYTTTAIHPYHANGWERKRVYPLMGFQSFLDIKSFSDAKYIRKYVSDESAFEKIIEVFEQGEGQKQFIFEVTMQNHGGYGGDYPDFTPTIELMGKSDSDASVKAVEQYLTLIQESDKAFSGLIQYFQKVDKPTVIVLFGDHQPADNITKVIARETGYDSKVSLAEYQKTYQVPFVIWDNIGLEKDASMELCSPNYLGAYLMECAGIPLSTYQKFLLELRNELPVICGGAYVDNAGIYYPWSEDKAGAYDDVLNAYSILQYNHLADPKNRIEDLFIN